MIGIELLVRPHQGDEVLGVTQIDDIVRPAGDHVNGFDLISRNLKANLLIRMDIALLDQGASRYDDKKLPLRVMPVLTLCDAGLTDIQAELSVIGGFQQLGERAAVVIFYYLSNFSSITNTLFRHLLICLDHS